MNNSLRKACILVALEMLDSEPTKKKKRKSSSSALPAEEVINAILETSKDMTFDSDLVECAKKIYNIAIKNGDDRVRLAGVRALKSISKECTFDSSMRACTSYMEALVV